MVTVEREDNWEYVITGADLDANGRIKIEDSQLNCALIREIGTDQATAVVFGVRDNPFITIDSFIAPYYRASNNMNVMRFSEKNGTKWKYTGFELPLSLDKELEITGLLSTKRVYMKGTLYRNVLSTDSPINQYLMSRLVEYPFKQMRPMYWKDVVIPAGLTLNKEYVLDDITDTLLAWDASDPKYTFDPSKNIYYVLRNTIQVLWNEEVALAKDIEFRLKHNSVDLKIQPRLDHMFFPPSDGATRYVTETLGIGGIDACETVWTGDATDVVVSLETTIKKEGTNSNKIVAGTTPIANNALIAHKVLAATKDISGYLYVGFWIGAVGTALADGGITLLLDDTAACTTPIEKLPLPYIPIATSPATLNYMIVRLRTPQSLSALASVGLMNTSGGNITTGNGIYIDDVRALPLKVSHNPIEELVSAVFTGGSGGAVSSVNYANGEIAITYDSIPTSLAAGYYAMFSGGGKDIFTLRNIAQQYHKLIYPNKQSYIFKNKGAGTPTGTKTMNLYTLAEYYQEVPPQQMIPPTVLSAAMGWLI